LFPDACQNGSQGGIRVIEADCFFQNLSHCTGSPKHKTKGDKDEYRPHKRLKISGLI
jgi:hypothetical protein